MSSAESETIRREYRSLPLWLAHDYLIALGGRDNSPYEIVGVGWRAVLSDAPDIVMGVVHIGQIQVLFHGDPASVGAVLASFERKALRAGG